MLAGWGRGTVNVGDGDRADGAAQWKIYWPATRWSQTERWDAAEVESDMEQIWKSKAKPWLMAAVPFCLQPLNVTIWVVFFLFLAQMLLLKCDVPDVVKHVVFPDLGSSAWRHQRVCIPVCARSITNLIFRDSLDSSSCIQVVQSKLNKKKYKAGISLCSKNCLTAYERNKILSTDMIHIWRRRAQNCTITGDRMEMKLRSCKTVILPASCWRRVFGFLLRRLYLFTPELPNANYW